MIKSTSMKNVKVGVLHELRGERPGYPSARLVVDVLRKMNPHIVANNATQSPSRVVMKPPNKAVGDRAIDDIREDNPVKTKKTGAIVATVMETLDDALVLQPYPKRGTGGQRRPVAAEVDNGNARHRARRPSVHTDLDKLGRPVRAEVAFEVDSHHARVVLGSEIAGHNGSPPLIAVSVVNVRRATRVGGRKGGGAGGRVHVHSLGYGAKVVGL